MPIKDNTVRFAAEAKISVISNPYDTTNGMISALLENYFSEPRLLRKNDLFGIDVKECISDQVYLLSNSSVSVIYFKVNTIKVNNKDCISSESSYILHGETTLIQEPNIQSYIPRKHLYLDRTMEELIEPYPPSFAAPLEHLERCILPFINCGEKRYLIIHDYI